MKDLLLFLSYIQLPHLGSGRAAWRMWMRSRLQGYRGTDAALPLGA